MPRDRRKNRRKWSYTAGEYGATVRVSERGGPGGIIYAATSDGQGGEIRESLGYKVRDAEGEEIPANVEAAKDYADDEARKLRKGLDSLSAGRPTLRRIFGLYERERTPDKAEATQAEDRRQMAMFRRLWGAEFDLSKLDRVRWERFIRERRAGTIDARGHRMPEQTPCGCTPEERPGCDRCGGTGTVDPRRPVGDRTVERDLKFLRAVCRWATGSRDADGRLLLGADPTRGLDVPAEKNPARPVATHDRVDAIRAVYHEVRMRVEWNGRRERIESHLPELFEVVVGTGRRISAVCQLRAEDLDLDPSPKRPHGAITWPGETDKQGRRWHCPTSEPVRDALEAALRKRQAVGPGPLFPSPTDIEKPVRYDHASRWLREAERRAGLDPHEGSLWHAYRRLWATARKDLPDVDVAQAGGWASLDALKLAYQQPDDATMLRVVTHGAELRELRG